MFANDAELLQNHAAPLQQRNAADAKHDAVAPAEIPSPTLSPAPAPEAEAVLNEKPSVSDFGTLYNCYMRRNWMNNFGH